MRFRHGDSAWALLALVSGSIGCHSESVPVELWVSDVGAGDVRVFDDAGTERGRLDDATVPAGVAVDGFAPSAVLVDGREVLVTNFASGEVLAFDRATLAFSGVFRPESLHARLEEPCMIRRAGDTTYVLGNDSWNLVALDAAGQVLQELGTTEPIRSPHGFDVGPDGLVYVATSVSTRHAGLIQVWDPSSGTRVDDFASWTEIGQGTGVTVGPDGLLWVVDWFGDQVVRYDPDTGSLFDTVLDAADVQRPVSIAFGPDGVPWVLDAGGVLQLRSDGPIRVVDGIDAGLIWARNLEVVARRPSSSD